ncbi:MAG TPA: helicase associated domain-containing protein [Candidatus Kapabacteria bacterium]|nr:helicase associated domain-containing protein [Candidatus Kapabacteria bacterium]HPO63175.1 helicase associated domain-containing protein [Candidatus Kapabacteria bacterium]
MAKYVVRKGKAILEIEQDTRQEKLDKKWLTRYNELLAYIKEKGNYKFPHPKSKNFEPKYYSLQRWVGHQRNFYKKGKLDDWKIKLLEKINFIFSPNEEEWNRKFNALVEFKKVYGHCNVLKKYRKFSELNCWISYLRNKKETLPPQRVKQLDSIGFLWSFYGTRWEHNYKELEKYIEANGSIDQNLINENISNSNRKIVLWIRRQIIAYNKNELSEQQINLLKKCNIELEYKKKSKEKNWEKYFCELLEYKKLFGNLPIPFTSKEYSKLRIWIFNVRYHKNKLSDEQIKKLDNIGFDWNYQKKVIKFSNDKVGKRLNYCFTHLRDWEKNISLLKEFANEKGHCNLIATDNKRLYHWLCYIRRVKKGVYKFQLEKEKIKQLEDLGIIWDKREAFWEECYQRLAVFKELNGNCIVPSFDKVLYNWCQVNRRKKNLSQDKKARLDALGFDWETKRKKK